MKANGKGLAEVSLEAMKAHHHKLKEIWGIQTTQELWIPGTTLDAFIGGLIDGL